VGDGGGIEEDQVGDAVGVADGVFEGEEGAPGVAEEDEGVEVEVRAEALEVFDLGLDCDVFGLDVVGGPAAATLVVEDEVERGEEEAVEVREEVGVVEIGGCGSRGGRGCRGVGTWEL
jgi:hypothetical protein